LKSVDPSSSTDRPICRTGRVVRIKPGWVHGFDTMKGNKSPPV
jgi:hypothetical protein